MHYDYKVWKDALIFKPLSVIVALRFLKLRFQLSKVSVMAQTIFSPVWSSYKAEVCRENEFKSHLEIIKCTASVKQG